MSHSKRVLIFIVSIILVFGLLVLLSSWLASLSIYIPKWPALIVIMGLYFYLFPKKQRKEK